MSPPLPVPPVAPQSPPYPTPPGQTVAVEPPAKAARAQRAPRFGAVALIVGAVLLLLLGAAIGIAIRQRAVNTQRDRADTAVGQNATSKASLQAERRKVAALQSQLNARQVVIASQNRRLASLNEETAAVKRQQAALDREKAQLDEREAALNERAAELDQQAAQQGASTPTPTPAPTPTPTQSPPAVNQADTFGDGLFQIGVDIQPGQYRTEGGPTCYWATLSSADANSILDDHSGAGPQTVSIDAPYFASDGCGTWRKVG